jgi:hypothetical protein
MSSRYEQIIDRKFPTAQIHIEQIRDIFDKYASKEHVLGLDQLAFMFIDISKSMTALPAVRIFSTCFLARRRSSR